MQNLKMKITLVLGLSLVAFMVNGSSLSSGSAMRAYATTQTLPSCTDPTGQNLRCMMVISTLPPPPNALQCQETSGQILPCSYTTQNLSNGEQIVAITVYVPTSYLFTGYGSWTVVKQVVHETKTTTKTKIVLVTQCSPTQKWNPVTHKCVDICPPGKYLVGNNCVPIPPNTIHCLKGYHSEFVDGKWRCVPDIVPYVPPLSCDSKYYTGPCPPTDINAYTKCMSAALLANDEKGQLACARLLPDTPENAYTKCMSEALIKDDLRAELACAKYLPSASGAMHNMTNTTIAAAPSNTSAALQPINTSIPTTPSGGKGSGSTCAAGNCTSGTPPPVDCVKNPTDPSCVTKPATPTQTCPDGSVIAATDLCPQAQTPPTTKTCPDGSTPASDGSCPSPNNNPPPSNPSPSTPPSTSSPPPSDGGNSGNGGSGSSGSGGSDKGSSPPQPSTSS